MRGRKKRGGGSGPMRQVDRQRLMVLMDLESITSQLVMRRQVTRAPRSQTPEPSHQTHSHSHPSSPRKRSVLLHPLARPCPGAQARSRRMQTIRLKFGRRERVLGSGDHWTKQTPPSMSGEPDRSLLRVSCSDFLGLLVCSRRSRGHSAIRFLQVGAHPPGREAATGAMSTENLVW